jgi:hypothetical protein
MPLHGCRRSGLKRRPLLRTSSPLKTINRKLTLALAHQTGALQVHPWRGKSKEPLIDLGPYEPKLRSFVRGDSELSQEFALLVTVIPPPVKPVCFYEPCENVGGDPGFHIFAFYISGIEFRLAVGKIAAEPRRAICISGGLVHPIFLEDI